MNRMRIFNNFITSLGKQNLMAVKYENLKVYAIINPLDSVFENENVPDATIINELNKKDSSNREFINIRKFKDYKLLNVKERSFNKDTLEDSEHSYQEMLNTNVKEFLFYNNVRSQYSPIKKSLDYEDAAAVYKYDKNKTGNEPTVAQRSRYKAMLSDYNIEGNDYKETEYSRLNVDENQIIESEIVLSANDFAYTEYNAKDKILNHGIYGFYLTIAENTTVVGKWANDNVPVMVYLFDHPTYSNYNKIKLVFNANGLFGVV